MSAMTWRPQEGKRAWWIDGNVDVIRVYKRTATVQYWGRALSEGKLITHRGVLLSWLSAPRKMVGDKYVAESPIMKECDECMGHGEVQADCYVCAEPLTNYNIDDGENDYLCKSCAAKGVEG